MVERAGQAKSSKEAIDKAEGQVRQWEAWYERKQSAEKKGQPFDEPPPGQEGHQRDSEE